MNGDGDVGWRARVARACERIREGHELRADIAELLVLALLTGEHALLVGPPGSGKTTLARSLASTLRDARVFEALITPSSSAEDVFGPLSVPALEAGRFERSLDGHLATAHVALLDEVLDAEGAVLGGLVSVLGDRVYPSGGTPVRTPLVVAMGTVRSLPQDLSTSASAALAERFLFTAELEAASSLETLLCPPPRADSAASLTVDDVSSLRASAKSLPINPLVARSLAILRTGLTEARLPVSDGRWRRIGGVLRIAAAAADRSRVELDDLWIVPHALVHLPAERALARTQASASIRALTETEPARLASQVEVVAREIAADASASELATDTRGAALFVDEEGQQTTPHARTRHLTDAHGNPLYHPPHDLGSHLRRLTFDDLWQLHFQRLPGGMARLKAYCSSPTHQILEEIPRTPVRRPKRHPRAHLTGRRASLEALTREVEQLAAALVEARARSGRWLVGDVDGALATLHAALTALERASAVLDKLPCLEP